MFPLGEWWKREEEDNGQQLHKSVICAAESLGAYRRERYVFLTREKSSGVEMETRKTLLFCPPSENTRIKNLAFFAQIRIFGLRGLHFTKLGFKMIARSNDKNAMASLNI